MKKFLALFLASIFVFPYYALSCTNLLVTKGASKDGSTMITYSADAGGFMEPLFWTAGGKHAAGELVDIYDWDSGKYLGKIKQVAETYKVIGNMNEWQVAIGETTFGGREKLRDTTAIMDYGSLIYVALQRAKTAREAIKVMTDLVKEYGYYSGGESFSVADPNEVWILEMITKGPFEKGAVWVARLVPDGYICAHANQARIREFPLNKPLECVYAPDVITFAEKHGFYDSKLGKPFSFVDAYCPLDPGNLMFCEGRVWSLFRRSAPSLNLSSDYMMAVEGAEPYPLFIKPDQKLSVRDVMGLMRDHFEGTELDMTKGIVAGAFGNPYRWKPLSFKLNGDTVSEYGWERPISTQQTAFSFVAQMRSFMPREIGGVFWYGVDDTYSTVYIPLYANITKAPTCFTGGSIKEVDLNSGFWVFNLVSNLAYTKYSYIIEDVKKEQKRMEDKFEAFQTAIEKAATDLYAKDKDLALAFLTDYSNSQAQQTVDEWRSLWKALTAKYNDGYINNVNKDNGRHPKGLGYGDDMNKRSVQENPGRYEVKWRKKK